MAYALAIQSIFDYGVKGQIILYTTMVFTLITILGVGSFLQPILTTCDVMRKPTSERSNQKEMQNEGDESEREKCCLKGKIYLYNFNVNYFAPFFIRADANKDSNVNKEHSPQNQQSEAD